MSDPNLPAVLVIGETFNDAPRPVSLEAIHAARAVADGVGGTVICAVLGADATANAIQFQTISGVDRIVALNNEQLDHPLGLPWTSALHTLTNEIEPLAVLIPGSITGRDYAARLAARLGSGLASDCVHVDVVDNTLEVRRAVLGGRVQTKVTFKPSKPAVITIAPGVFPQAGMGDDLAPVEVRHVDIPERDGCVRLLESTPHTAVGKALGSAEKIVSGGRGLAKPENFRLVEELAAELGATVGASGAVVGAGWRPHADQVGSTGHTVAPRLYVAIGISGAPQHLVGMQGSENVVAINRDPDAPIFGAAAFGVVGDLFEVVPALTRKLKDARADHG